jgi:hypothetical protein
MHVFSFIRRQNIYVRKATAALTRIELRNKTPFDALKLSPAKHHSWRCFHRLEVHVDIAPRLAKFITLYYTCRPRYQF